MALFRRKPTTEIPELREYYENEKNDRPVVAWVLAIVSLLSTVVIVLALFFAGRWLYRTVKKDNNGTQPTTAVTGTSTPNDESESGNSSPVTTTTPSTNSTPTPVVNSSTDSTPATGPLPNTGPSGPEDQR